MSQETDVNNCFDSAFFEVVNQHPDPNKSISDDYATPASKKNFVFDRLMLKL